MKGFIKCDNGCWIMKKSITSTECINASGAFQVLFTGEPHLSPVDFKLTFATEEARSEFLIGLKDDN